MGGTRITTRCTGDGRQTRTRPTYELPTCDSMVITYNYKLYIGHILIKPIQNHTLTNNTNVISNN